MASSTPGSLSRMRSSDIVVDDAALSLAAKGAFVIVTLLGNGCSVEEIARHAKETPVAVEAALLELRERGYLRFEAGRASLRDAADFGLP